MKKQDVAKIAQLARLALSEEELQKFGEQMPKILDFFEQLQALDTTGVEPLMAPSPLEFVAPFVAQADEVVLFADSPEPLLAQAPERQGNLFKVPPVV